MEQLDASDAPQAGAVDAAVVVRALALLEQGRAGDARDLLADALASLRADAFTVSEGGAGFGPLADAELESAFEDATPETESMIDADGIAYEAIVRAKLDEPESVPVPPPDSPFHTRTMADLLERQGDRDGARAIRAVLTSGRDDERAAADPGAAARARTIQTLERWLARLRGGDA